MRISYLASAVLAIWLLPLSTTAFAGCGSANCSSSGTAITYGSGSYGALSTSSKYHSNSHVSQGINTSFGTSFGAASIVACPSGTIRINNGSNNGYCTSASSRSSVGFSSKSASASSSSYGSTLRSTSRSTGQVVPFTTTVSKISNIRVAGMGSNEFLSPTTCPTNVYNPGGNKVLGCYSVVKPVQTVRQVQTVRPVPQIRYQQVRVVRPIIYVRYPVPVPMPVPVCRTQTVCGGGCNSTTYSRYGNTWSNARNNCGGW